MFEITLAEKFEMAFFGRGRRPVDVATIDGVTLQVVDRGYIAIVRPGVVEVAVSAGMYPIDAIQDALRFK